MLTVIDFMTSSAVSWDMAGPVVLQCSVETQVPPQYSPWSAVSSRDILD